MSETSTSLGLGERLNGWSITAGLAALTIVCMIFVDLPLARFFQSHTDHPAVNAFRSITGLAHGAIWYGLAAGGMVVSWLFRAGNGSGRVRARWNRRIRCWWFMIVSMAASALLVNALKVIIGRLRPRYYFAEDLVGFQPFNFDFAMNTFPSGHAQGICAAMAALVIIMPRIWPLAVLLAVLVSASRFVTAVHFLSDVIAGAAIGIAVALYLARRFEESGPPLKLVRR